MSEFLQKARELDLPGTGKWTKMRYDFMHKCWPEIIAVVEAAQEVEQSDGSESPLRKLWHALDALDKKAGER